MVPGNYPIVIYRGGTYCTGITAKNSNGTSMDFRTYASIRMQVRPPWAVMSVVMPMPLLELTTENGGIVVSPDGTGFTLNIPSATTAVLSFTDGKYDLELISGSSTDKLLYGSVQVKDEVTV